MAVLTSMLRGINLGTHHRIKMDELRALYESIGLQNPQTYVQSGNVTFQTDERSLKRVAAKIEEAILGTFGFRSDVILRTTPDLEQTIAQNPFAGRPDVAPNRLLVLFLVEPPARGALDKVAQIKTTPEELRVAERELYIHFPNGMGQSKLSLASVERTLGTPGTGRNWNSVVNLLKIAKQMEAD